MKTQDPEFNEDTFIKQLEAEIADWFNNIDALYDKAYLLEMVCFFCLILPTKHPFALVSYSYELRQERSCGV